MESRLKFARTPLALRLDNDSDTPHAERIDGLRMVFVRLAAIVVVVFFTGPDLLAGAFAKCSLTLAAS